MNFAVPRSPLADQSGQHAAIHGDRRGAFRWPERDETDELLYISGRGVLGCAVPARQTNTGLPHSGRPTSRKSRAGANEDHNYVLSNNNSNNNKDNDMNESVSLSPLAELEPKAPRELDTSPHNHHLKAVQSGQFVTVFTA